MTHCFNSKPISNETFLTLIYYEHMGLLSEFQNRTQQNGPALRTYGIKSLAIQPTGDGSFGNSNYEEMKKLYQAVRSFRTLETLYIVPKETGNLGDVNAVCELLEQEHKKYEQVWISVAFLFWTVSRVKMTRLACCILSHARLSRLQFDPKVAMLTRRSPRSGRRMKLKDRSVTDTIFRQF
jgi:hypothetical protein